MENVPSKNTGEPLPAVEFNNGLMNENKNAVTSSGQTLDGGDQNQQGRAMAIYGSNGDFYVDSGSVNAYVLNPLAAKQAPETYRDGQRVRFIAGSTNTANCTVNVNSVSQVPIKFPNNTALGGGEIEINQYVELAFKEDGASSRFVLVNTTAHEGDEDYREGVVNGSMTIKQRADRLLTVNLTDAPVVDTYRVAVDNVTAGFCRRSLVAPVGTLGRAMFFDSVSTSGGDVISQHRMEASLAEHYVGTNARCSFRVDVHQNTGAAINYSIELRSADALNEFSSSTQFPSGLIGSLVVANSTPTTLVFENVEVPASARNGIEIIVRATVAGITTRNFYFTQYQLNRGAVAQDYRLNDATRDLGYAHRYYRKSFPDGSFVGEVTPGIGALTLEGAYSVNATDSTVRGALLTVQLAYPPMVKLPVVSNIILYNPNTGAQGEMYVPAGVPDFKLAEVAPFKSSQSSFIMERTGTGADHVQHIAQWDISLDL